MFPDETATSTNEVTAHLDMLRGLVARLDPAAVPLPEAPGLWHALNSIERLAAAAQTLLAPRVDESKAWQRAGYRSAAEYLARQSGSSVRAARVALTTARRLADLPATAAALRRGDLSGAQCERIADAATVAPERETELLAAASRVSLAELVEACGRIKAAADPDPDATYERIHRNRRLRQHTDSEGAWHLSGYGTPEAGSLLNTALGPLIDELYDQARHSGEHHHRDTYVFDALVELLNRAIDGHYDPDQDDDPDEDDEDWDDEADSLDDPDEDPNHDDHGDPGENDEDHDQGEPDEAGAPDDESAGSGAGRVVAAFMVEGRDGSGSGADPGDPGDPGGTADRDDPGDPGETVEEAAHLVGYDRPGGCAGSAPAKPAGAPAGLDGPVLGGEPDLDRDTTSGPDCAAPVGEPPTGTAGPDPESGEPDDQQNGDQANPAEPREADQRRRARRKKKTSKPKAGQNQKAKNGRKKRRRRSRDNPRYMGLLRIDYTALVRGHVEGDEVCEISGVGPVSVQAALRLLDEATVKLLITKGTDVVNVTHLGRRPTVAQHVALLWQNPGCSAEGCPHSFVQTDHRDPWANTHRTVLGELDHLCPHDHRLKTFFGWSLIEGTGTRAFVPPTDPRHPNNQTTEAAEAPEPAEAAA
jgi:hypothetical protein